MNEDVAKTRALGGYFTEYQAAAYLISLLESSSISVTDKSKNNIKEANNKRQLLKKENVSDDIIKMYDDQSKLMAKTLYNNILSNSKKVIGYSYDIEATGDSAKGVSKADLKITPIKDGKKAKAVEVSLKAYQKPTITLANPTLISILGILLLDDKQKHGIPSKIEEQVSYMNKIFGYSGKSSPFEKLKDIQIYIREEVKHHAKLAGKTAEQIWPTVKNAVRNKAKALNNAACSLIIQIFDKEYKKNKIEINKRMMKLLGLDGSDQFLAVIGDKVIDSSTNKKFDDMVKALASNNFDFVLESNGAKGMNVKFNQDKRTILDGTIGISDTGGAGAVAKISFQIKFKQFL